MATRNMDWFLDYWDDVIRQWLDGHIEDRQQTFLNKEMLHLNNMHMPEPYWGDPNRCSIVIANYNPGGGADRSRHTYRECAWCPDSFINQVKKQGYSKVALEFPIIDDADNEDKTFCWWKEYGGRKWWLNKMKWLDEIGEEIPNYKESAKKPFALEFCGWHSTSWPANACSSLYVEETIWTLINCCFIKPLVDVVHNSDTHFGLCVGSQFFHLFNKIEENGRGIKRTDTEIYGKDAPCHIHLYQISGEHIIVMWGKGRNRYPKGINPKLNDFIKKYLNNK